MKNLVNRIMAMSLVTLISLSFNAFATNVSSSELNEEILQGLLNGTIEAVIEDENIVSNFETLGGGLARSASQEMILDVRKVSADGDSEQFVATSIVPFTVGTNTGEDNFETVPLFLSVTYDRKTMSATNTVGYKLISVSGKIQSPGESSLYVDSFALHYAQLGSSYLNGVGSASNKSFADTVYYSTNSNVLRTLSANVQNYYADASIANTTVGGQLKIVVKNMNTGASTEGWLNVIIQGLSMPLDI